jgi:predicted PurR-regulated permease PerM
MTIRRVAIHTAVILGTLAVVFLLYEFRLALILFILSLAVAAATRPYVEFLTTRGVKRTLAIMLVYLLFLAFLAMLFVIGGGQMLRELQVLADSLAQTYDQIWTQWPEGTAFQQLVARQLPAPADLYASFSLEQENSLLQGLLGFTMGSAALIGNLVTVLILSLYWSIDRVHFERLWLSVLPVESRARSRDIWRDIEHDFGAYVRSEVLQSIFAGILIGVGLKLMGVKYFALLGLFAALAWLIPWLGGVLAVVPVTLTALSQSLGLGIFATVYAIAVLFFLEFYMEQRFIRRSQYSSLLSILLILALIEPFGLVGFIVAPPLAAAIQLLFRYNLAARQTSESQLDEERLTTLRARLEDIRKLAETSSEPLEPQTLNLLERLENLIERSDSAVKSKQPAAVQQAQPAKQQA